MNVITDYLDYMDRKPSLMLVYFNEIDVEKSTFQMDLFYYFRRTKSFAHNAFYEL